MTDDAKSTRQIRQEAQIAAKWWADTLREEPTIDIGDVKAEAIMNWARDRTPDIPDETINAFEEELAMEIEDMVRDVGWDPSRPRQGQIHRTLRVDYHPDETLRIAAEAVGIDVGMTTFPSKTDMWINPGMIEVKAGYSADTETLWTDEGEDA